MNRIDICKNIIQSINEYITNPDKLEPHREKNHFIRKRKLSLFQVILYLLYSSKASMFQNLSCIREDLPSLDFPAVSKQALSKARQFISPSLFKELFYLSVDLFYSQIPSRSLWHQLFQDSLRCRSQIIPGRSFRRKKSKTKGRTHFNNQKAAF